MNKNIIILCSALFLCLIPLVIHAHDDLKKRKALNQKIDRIITLSGIEALSNFHRRIDTLRAFINDHSQHNIDEQFYKIWRDQNLIAQSVIDHADGARAETPHLECSTRSGLMEKTLQRLGYKTRTIYIYNPHENLSSHTFLEVLNPDTKKWEAQDPDYDIYWRATGSDTRASIMDAAFNPDGHEPCGRSGCGWTHVSREGIKARALKPFLAMVSVVDRAKKKRFTAHAASILPATQYTLGDKTGTFCDHVRKNCRDGFTTIEEYKDAP